jgi:hypothetical protein
VGKATATRCFESTQLQLLLSLSEWVQGVGDDGGLKERIFLKLVWHGSSGRADAAGTVSAEGGHGVCPSAMVTERASTSERDCFESWVEL